MILVLGGSGYIGRAFTGKLKRRQRPFVSLSRRGMDYTRFDLLREFLKAKKPEFVVNAAGYTGKPNVGACETARADTLAGNTLLPHPVAHACAAPGVPWGHVSSGCIFSGAKATRNGRTRAERDLTKPEVRALVEQSPERIHGFTGTDTPTLSFCHPPCSFYSGTKALGEEAIASVGQSYIWRWRIPLGEFDRSRNYLSKVQRSAKAYENVNSISHRADAARACFDHWERRAAFGVYNVTNPGFITTRQVIEMIQQILKPAKRFEFCTNDEEFYRTAAKMPRSNCVMDVSKLLAADVKVCPVTEALEYSLRNWKPESPSTLNPQP